MQNEEDKPEVSELENAKAAAEFYKLELDRLHSDAVRYENELGRYKTHLIELNDRIKWLELLVMKLAEALNKGTY